MAFFIADEVSSLMIKKNINIDGANVLIMGLTFKENCPDVRNTKISDLISKFRSLSCHVDVYDPFANSTQALLSYNIKLIEEPKKNFYDAIILTVAHDIFIKMTPDQIKSFGKDNHILYDVKHIFNSSDTDGRL